MGCSGKNSMQLPIKVPEATGDPSPFLMNSVDPTIPNPRQQPPSPDEMLDLIDLGLDG
jgi:hypothetical protein